jgi:hypothetical protein
VSAEQDQWHDWLTSIQNNGVNLTTWELDFVESISQQLAAGRRMSEKQAEILERIYAEKTP